MVLFISEIMASLLQPLSSRQPRPEDSETQQHIESLVPNLDSMGLDDEDKLNGLGSGDSNNLGIYGSITEHEEGGKFTMQDKESSEIVYSL